MRSYPLNHATMELKKARPKSVPSLSASARTKTRSLGVVNKDPPGNLHIPPRQFIWLVGLDHNAGRRRLGGDEPESGE